jgi:predicted DNA-binding transcriptional regulator YafY
MPSSTTRNTIIRQWELLKLLPSRGAGKTAREIAESLNALGFKVSKRQVERDLGVLLESHFPIDCNNASVPYGWRWIKDAAVDIPALSLAEALSMQLIHETLEPILPKSMLDVIKPKLDQAKNKLASLAPSSPQARWPEKVRNVPACLHLVPPRIDDAILEAVQEALLHGKQLEVDYLPMDKEEPANYLVHPLALVHRGSVPYLIATTFHYKDVRLYALHRIHKTELLQADANRLEGFDIDKYILEGGTQIQRTSNKTFNLKLRVSPWLARILGETPLAVEQTIKPDGELLIVQAKVIDTWQLHWWILSQGASSEVIAPKSLRESISNELKSASALYS